MKFPMHVTKDSLTVLIDGKAWQTDSTNVNWSAIIAALNDDSTTAAQLVTLLSPEQLVLSAIGQMSVEAQDVVGVHNGSVWFKGEVVNNALCNIILNIAGQGLNPDPWLKFTNKLFQNPSETARNELYLWLDKSNLPISPDGDFIAYKRVRGNYKDIYTGAFDNSVGQVVSMPRENVDPVRDHLCSTGLHFCSKDYLPHFGVGSAGNNKVVLVKINPADVVSIPSDYDNAKGRTWRYEVVGEIDPADVDLHVWPAVADGYDAHEWDDDYDYDPGYDEEAVEADLERTFDAYINEAFVDGMAEVVSTEEEVVTVEPVIHSKSLGEITRQRFTAWLNEYGSQAAIGRALGKSSGTVQSWYVKLFG